MSDISAGSRARKGKTDQFANVAFGDVLMSAANTLTFEQIQMAVGLFQGIAMVIHRVLWLPTATSVRELVAATDTLTLAITTTNRLSSISDITDPAIIAYLSLVGIGANTEPIKLPLESDFTSLPGGGKIVAANPLYIGMNTAGAAAASRTRCQLDFTFLTLADRDYLELLQAQFPANIS